jgi:hypothetical protein
MASITQKNFNGADQVRELDRTQVEIVDMPAGAVGRYTLQPGWRWSEHVGPALQQAECPNAHLGVLLSGALHVEMASGGGADFAVGDVYAVPPGHDAWVVGDEPVVVLEFESKTAESFAKTG